MLFPSSSVITTRAVPLLLCHYHSCCSPPPLSLPLMLFPSSSVTTTHAVPLLLCHYHSCCSPPPLSLPLMLFPSSSAVKLWLDNPSNFPQVEAEFNSTSNYAKLVSVFTAVAGRLLYIRFKAKTGDAMGMNMISKVSLHCASL